MTFIAHCLDCNKSYRVPHDQKTWSCKRCGGDLDLTPEEPETPGASHDGEGTSPEPDEVRATRQKRTRNRRAIQDVSRPLIILKIALLLGIAGYGLMLIGVLVNLLDQRARWDRFDTGDWVGVAVILGIIAVPLGASIAGLVYLRRYPYPVALTMAILATLNVLFSEGLGERVWGGLWALALWYCVGQAKKIRQLQRNDRVLRRKIRSVEREARQSGGL